MTPNRFLPAPQPDSESFLRCLKRQGTPARVHFIELFLDPEVQDSVARRFDLAQPNEPGLPLGEKLNRLTAVQRLLGYDYVRCGIDPYPMPLHRHTASDTAEAQRSGGRHFVDSQVGPITNWAEFERYPWPDPAAFTTRALEWFEQHLPDDMCIIGSGGFAHFAEHLTWLMGYETLCYALFDNRDLVRAIADRILEMNRVMAGLLLQFSKVRVLWGADDMGFRSGTLISPDDTREFFMPGHTLMARLAHEAGRPYLLHSCGRLDSIMEDLIGTTKIDGKHSFEDTIHDLGEEKRRYGSRIALLGGVDVDFLCRATPERIGERVRDILDLCQPGGGFCLGTGNSVANYIPLDHYLAMLEAGRRYA